MKLGEIIKARAAVSTLYREKLPVKLAYKFIKFLQKTQKDEDFLNEKLREIADEFGERDEKGEFVLTPEGGVRVKADMQKDCVAKTTELNEVTVDDPDIRFTLEELEELKLSVESLTALEPILNED